jgi:hypothetical protein
MRQHPGNGGGDDLVRLRGNGNGGPIKIKSGVMRKPPPTPKSPERNPTAPPRPSSRKMFKESSAMGR